MTRRVTKLDSIIDPRDPRTLLTAKDELDSIVADLGAMIVKSGSDHPMVNEISDLLRHSRMLQGHIERAIAGTIARGVDLTPSSTTGVTSTQTNTSNQRPLEPEPETEEDLEESEDEDEDEGEDEDEDNERYVNPPDLRREEIGKLLLLVARAYQTKHINNDQRALIKGHICRKAGYLRVILEQTDMNVVMGALSAIGRADDDDGDDE